MNRKRLARTGFLFVVAMFLLYWGINFLKGKDIFQTQDIYYAKYDRIDGLVESSPVMLNGYKIGSVSNISFQQDGSGKLLVEFVVPQGFQIPKESLAKIISIDLMGTKSVSLIINKNTAFHTSGDTLKSDIEGDLKEQVSMQVAPLKNKAEQLMGSLDSALTVVTYVFNERTRDNLKESFENMNNTILNLEATSEDLKEVMHVNKAVLTKILANIDSVTTEVNSNKKVFSQITQNMASFSDTLSNLEISPIISKAHHAFNQLDSIVIALKSGKGTMGKLLNDDKLYNNLQYASHDLDRLLKDIRLNPQRYIHFSAIDLGKDIYITASNENNRGIVFRVQLLSTEMEVPLASPIFNGIEVEQKRIVDSYHYYAQEHTKYQDALEQLEEVRAKFPDAEIIGFKNGRPIKLKKALRLAK
ncbi:MCE family protein [Prolixibacteraceae bacterium JC049]|nr:MCE family protein [Prolixibacteraceae bacterium JC049]